jgi:hypothetical protein
MDRYMRRLQRRKFAVPNPRPIKQACRLEFM